MTSIIILTYNNLDYTIQCIDSIRKYTETKCYELIIVDNKSIDGTIDWLHSHQNITVIFNNENLGFPKACNQGIEASNGDKILLLNNDTIVTENWLDNLVKCLESSEEIGAVGPVTNSSPYYQSIPVSYGTVDEMAEFAAAFNKSNPLLWEERQKLIGFCLLVKREVLDEVGVLDERYFPGNFEDDDLCCRIIKSGRKLMLCGDTFIHHYGGASFKKGGDLNSLVARNEEKFRGQWGFTSREHMDIHKELTALIHREPEERFRLLEIGCGTGANLLNIRNEYSNAELFGIDKCAKALEIASMRFECVCGDIEDMELPYGLKSYDFIVLGDVLQQLGDPNAVLGKLRNYLKSDGRVLLSVPNITNYYFVYNLLKGNSLYNNSTIEYFLNERNRRVFNLFDSFSMLEQQGYSDITGTKVYAQLESGDEAFINSLKNIVQSEDPDQFITRKYVLSAKPVDEQKVCFIFCVNDSVYYEEALKYISFLTIPENFTIENIYIVDAKSIASGYNEAMKASNARYKVYMHQDVFITDRDFLVNLLRVFEQSPGLGLLGVIGAKTIGASGVWWEGNECYGMVYDNHDGTMKQLQFNSIQNAYERAEVVDGLLIATRQDIPWRDDLFDGWHFYDASQSFEFRRAGYEVGILRQEQPCCVHDCGVSGIPEEYYPYRDIFVKEYLYE